MTMDAVDRLLLGLGPDDEVTLPGARRADVRRSAGPAGAVRRGAGPAAHHRELLTRLVESDGVAAQALTSRLDEAWAAADGDRRAYLRSVGEIRAELVSKAELEHVAEAGSAATEDVLDGIGVYLRHVQGRTR